MEIEPKPVKLAIIGGGAAGLFAAAQAAERRLGTVIIERKARLGSKVLMTANGRCNFTRDLSADDFLHDLAFGPALPPPPATRFLAEAVRECPPRQIIKFFQTLGVPLRRMADGRFFPADGKAATIVHAFGDLLRDRETPVLTNAPVKAISRDPHKSHRFLVETAAFALSAENVLIATGGCSYPKTGSVGDGLKFAAALGHRLVNPRPGLIGLETADERVTRLHGRRFEDGRAKVLAPDGATLYDYRGEVDCETFGLSGAAIYNCQRFLEYAARAGRPVSDFTLEVWFNHSRLSFRNLRPRPLKEAIVTLGGVALDEINPHTMESKLIPGLYFAGEVLDIDGPTGGYNLTLAFATARKAVAALENEKERKTPWNASPCKSVPSKSTARFSAKGKRR